MQGTPGEPAEEGGLGLRVAVPDVLVAENQVVGLYGIGKTGLNRADKELIGSEVLGMVGAHDTAQVAAVQAETHRQRRRQGQS